MSINKAVLYLVLACVLTGLIMTYIAKRMTDKPNRVQTAMEALYDLTYNHDRAREHVARDVAALVPVRGHALLLHLDLEPDRVHPAARPTPSTATNIFGLEVPTLALYAATANISVPIILTLVVWFAYQVGGHPRQGLRHLRAGPDPGRHPGSRSRARSS